MNRQLVKKSRTDKRKRKGYQGTKWYHKAGGTLNRTFNPLAPDNAILGSKILGSLNAGNNTLWSLIMGAGLFKEGGRVRGVGKATHGYGRAMRKRK